MTKKEQITRVIVMLAGLVIYQLGISILILSDFGPDPFNVLVQGFRNSMNVENLSFLPYGCVHIIVSALITFMLFLINRNFVKLGTILCMLLGGPLIDLFTLILTPVYEQYPDSTYFYMMFIGGFVMLTYGLSMMKHSKAGNVPAELLTDAFTSSKKKNSYFVGLAVSFVLAFAGFIMGGSIGFGTLLCMAAVSPFEEYFAPNLSKKIEEFVKKRIS